MYPCAEGLRGAAGHKRRERASLLSKLAILATYACPAAAQASCPACLQLYHRFPEATNGCSPPHLGLLGSQRGLDADERDARAGNAIRQHAGDRKSGRRTVRLRACQMYIPLSDTPA